MQATRSGRRVLHKEVTMNKMFFASMFFGSVLLGSGVVQATAAQIPATNINRPGTTTGQPTAQNTGTASPLPYNSEHSKRCPMSRV